VDARELRRKLRAFAWLVLEEVALDAITHGGRLVAHTSARRLAGQMGADAGAVSGALRTLRQQGLVDLERECGPAGRFGLSVYVLQDIPGLIVIPPCGPHPGMVEPHMVKPATVSTNAVESQTQPASALSTDEVAVNGATPTDASSCIGITGSAGSSRARRRSTRLSPPGQGRLEL